jgi:hypothetical protein
VYRPGQVGSELQGRVTARAKVLQRLSASSEKLTHPDVPVEREAPVEENRKSPEQDDLQRQTAPSTPS